MVVFNKTRRVSDFFRQNPTSKTASFRSLLRFFKIVLFCILFQVSTVVVGQDGDTDLTSYPSWTVVGYSNTVRVEAQTIFYNGELYFFNGFHEELDIENSVEKYNPVSNTWTLLASMPLLPDGTPNAVTHNGITLVDDQVWIIGGRVGDHPGVVTNKVWLYDISENTWSEGPGLPFPAAAGGVGRLGRKLHYVGGLDAQANCDVDVHLVYDLDNPDAGWEDLTAISPLPDARNHFGTAVLNGRLYVVGGQHGHDGCEMGTDVNLVHIFDPVTGQWSRGSDLPWNQSHIEPSTFVLDGEIYVVGGQITGNRVWRYNPDLDSWTDLDQYELPLALIAPGARVIESYMVVANGGGSGATQPQDETYLRDFSRTPRKILGFHPGEVTLTMDPGQTQEVRIILYNQAGEEDASYALVTNGQPAWLSASPTTGTARESFAEIVLSLSSAGLSAGTYTYDLAVSAPDYTGDVLPVTLIVNDDPVEPPPGGEIDDVSFGHSLLSGVTINNPTSLQFGPDGRLYVSQQNGTIYALTIARTAPNQYSVTATETILLVKNIPNHNDDGTLNTVEKNRQVTGLLVTGTAENPVLYVGSSDPRIGGGGTGGDKSIDTNSGIISRLTKTDGIWTKIDLVRGLPRSEENHATNGLQLDEVNNMLYVAQGGNTNAGAPSNNFAFLTEYALSAAVLSIDLNMIASMPVRGSGNDQYIYDLPTLDDPARADITNPDFDPAVPGSPQVIDGSDPFGGNDGLNQARLVPGGPVQVYSPGYRNIYDIVLTRTPGREGRMYTIDNGANGGWGGHPDNEGAFGDPLTTSATNNYVEGEPGSSGPGPNDAKVNNLDNLHLVSAPGLNPIYAGHSNPVRANPGGAGLYWYDNITGFANFSAAPTTDWPPVPLSMANPVEGDYRNPGVNDGALLTFSSSTNGLAEYTASNFFGGALEGELVTALYDGSINRIKLDATGTTVVSTEVLASGFGNNPLDVVCQNDNEIFPGTIWATAYGSNTINIFEPDQPLSWKNLPSSDGSLPQARHENAYVEAGGKFYLFGGRGDRDLDIYDPAMNTWSKGAKPPLQFHHFQAVTLNGLIYVMGAFVGTFPSETPVPDIYIYDPATNSWSQGPPIPEGRRRGAAGTVVHNNKIYLVCGIQNGHESGWVPWLDVFEPSTNSWVQLPDAPRARDHFHAAIVNDKLYNIAGRRSGEDGFLYARTVAEIDVFNLLTNSWETLPSNANIPTPRAGNSVAVMDNEVLVVGGETAQEVAHNETEAFDVSASTWRTLAPLVTGRHGTQIVTYDGKMFVTGGSGNRGGSPELNSQEVFVFSRVCTGDTSSLTLDDDTDGYSNGDESANGTNPCSALSIPPDFNENFLSDLNDPDDDGDGIPDVNDAFARDAANGTTRNLPVDYPFLNGDPGTGLFGLGFTGLMSNGIDHYLNQYDESHPDLIMGGAVGLASFPAGSGDALTNDQQYGFQFGVNVNTTTNTFFVESQILGNPYFNGVSAGDLKDQTQGIYIGTGNQDDYLKIVLAANHGNPGIQILYENAGTVVLNNTVAIGNILSEPEITLVFEVDAINGTVQPGYFTGSNPEKTSIGSVVVLSGALKAVVQGDQALAVGLIASSGTADPFLVSYNGVSVTSPAPSVVNPVEDISRTVNLGNLTIDLSTVFADDGGVDSLTLIVESISNPELVVQTSIAEGVLTLHFAPDITGSSEITVRATDKDLFFAEDHFVVTINNDPVSALLRLNAGGPATSFNDEVWQVDQYASGGTTYTNAIAIEGTDNDVIYQSERYGVYSYEIPLAEGVYDVQLHFAEIFYGVMNTQGVGARVFNVDVENGQGTLLNYDIFERAGGAATAIRESMNGIHVNDGLLTITLSKVTNNPKLSGIEIYPSTYNQNLPPVVVNPGTQSFEEGSAVTLQIEASDPNAGDTLVFTVSNLPASLVIDDTTGLITGSIEANAGNYTATVRVTDQEGLFDEETFNISVTESTIGDQALFSINAGGPSLIHNEVNWLADQYATGGTAYKKILAIEGTTNDEIYHSERYGTFTYNIPLTSGRYLVRLHLAEIFYMAAGKRIFNVKAEGVPWLTSYDIYADVGYATATIKDQELEVLDGMLDLEFYPSVNNAKISGLEIFAAAEGNRAPVVAAAIADQFAVEEAEFSFTVPPDAFTDPDGDALTYTAFQTGGGPLPEWLLFDAASRTFSGTPGAGDTGLYNIEVVASDGAASASDVFVLTVESAPNTAPVVSNAIPDQVAREAELFSFTFADNAFTDADGDTLRYTASLSGDLSLPQWLSFHESSRTFSGTPGAADVGSLTISVTASDGTDVVSDIFNLVVESAPNTAPVVSNAIPDQVATEGEAFLFTFAENTFTDADGDPLTYTASLSNDAALPQWLSFDAASRTFSGTPGGADVGSLTISVTASDGTGGVSDIFNLVVESIPNTAPVVSNAIPDQVATESEAFLFTFAENTFTDADGDPLTYTAALSNDAALPQWLTFDATSRTFSGTPGAGDVGSLAISVTASDGTDAVSDIFNLEIESAPNTAPVVSNAIPDQVATEGEAFLFTFAENTFTDADGDPLTYTAALSNDAALPQWLSFDAASRTFSGTPGTGDVGTLNVKVTASDESYAVHDVFDITVQAAAGAVALRVNAGGETYYSTIGVQFAGDTYFTSIQSTTGFSNKTVKGTPESLLYQSFRNGHFTYNFPVTTGVYQVVLHFNEVWDGRVTGKKGVGSRLFNVKAESIAALTNYDVYSKAGATSQAVSESFNVDVTDGTLDLEFVPVVNGAIVSAIEVIPIETPTSTLSMRTAEPKAEILFAKEVSDIRLYPNPVTDVIYLELNDEYSGAVSITIYDQLGRSYLNTELPSGQERFEIILKHLDLTPGTFYCRISSGNRATVVKFIKM